MKYVRGLFIVKNGFIIPSTVFIFFMRWMMILLQFNGSDYKITMSYGYHNRVHTEQALRVSNKPNKPPTSSSSYLKNFKKNAIQRQSVGGRMKNSSSNRSIASNGSSKSIKKSQPVHHPEPIQPMQYIMQETDNSMEEMLNSSINHFQRMLIRDNQEESLEEQNYRLKHALTKMKTILKDKLENALQKQKQQLSKMLEDYISLITKLLQDKEELTQTLTEIQEKHHQQMKKVQFDWGLKIKAVVQERDQHISTTKNQIEEFLTVIEQYEQEAKMENDKYQELNKRIEELEEQNKHLREKEVKSSQFDEYSEELSARIEAQSNKIQTLLCLLEKSQEQNHSLREALSSYQQKSQSQTGNAELHTYYEKKIQQMEEQHEEEFLQYERAIKQTIKKKDECIERLNLIIEELREKKIAGTSTYGY